MKTMKCRCGFDSLKAHPGSGFTIANLQRLTGMIFVFLNDGESTWICRSCARKAQHLIEQVNEIVGSDGWSPFSMTANKV